MLTIACRMLEAKKKEASRSASRVAFRAALDSQLLEKRLRENRDVSVPDSPLPYVLCSLDPFTY